MKPSFIALSTSGSTQKFAVKNCTQILRLPLAGTQVLETYSR